MPYDDAVGRLKQKVDNDPPGELGRGLYFVTGETTAVLMGQPENNVCYSPLSLYCVLLLAAGGAEGRTQAELYDALGLTDAVNAETTSLASSEMAGRLYRRIHLDDEQRAVEIAHSVWLQKGYDYEPGFLDMAAAQYGELYSVSFGDPAADGAMSRWVAEHTWGLLALKMETGDGEQSLALLNTVYLKAPWVHAFSVVRPQTFFLEDGTELTCDFMGSTFTGAYHSVGDGYQWVALTLEGGIQLMALVLPGEGVSLGSLLSAKDKVLQLISTGRGIPRKVHVELPAFAYDTSIDLKEVLHAMGIQAAFTRGEADFTALAEAPLMLTEVRQDTRIAVDENGVEPAAFSLLEAPTMAVPGQKEEDPIYMVFDRPFFYCVAVEGYPLFVGVVMDPSK